MADLLTIPMEDDFETTLSALWNWSTGSMPVNSLPSGTIPAGKYSYVVVNPWESNMQVAKIDGWSGWNLSVSSITVPQGQWGNYTQKSHAANSVVRFSNNYAFWKDILDSINSKLDTDWGNGATYADTAARDAALGADWAATKNYRMVKAWSGFYNYNLTTAQWQVVSTGTAPQNGSESVVGMFQQSTQVAYDAWTDLGSLWAQNVPKNSQIQASFTSIRTTLLNRGKAYQLSINNFNL